MDQQTENDHKGIWFKHHYNTTPLDGHHEMYLTRVPAE